MKPLSEILYKAGITEVVGTTSEEVCAVTADSRMVAPGGVFVAVKGVHSDGHKYIPSAVASGAKAIVCEEFPSLLDENVVWVKVSDSSFSLGHIASNFYDNPSSRLKLIGVTGTNGKTTIASLLSKLFTMFGYKTGLISTVKYMVGDKEYPSTHTTPDAISLNSFLAQMVDAGCQYCFMEVSSHAVVQHRITGLQFAGGIFTNLTHDHLDYHKTFDAYIKAKKGFFDSLPSDAFALTNVDDRNGMVMLQNTKASQYMYSMRAMADFNGKILENQFTGMLMQINNKELWCKLVGTFNAYNLLAVYGGAVLSGLEPEHVLIAISQLESVEGRFQYFVSPNKVVAIVDYAHTPDALDNVLQTINNLRTRQEQLITVVGCGGDRDASKRPVMAQLAARKSDRSIFTSDNPRSEDPDEIIREMMAGVDASSKRKVISISNRREAIHAACMMAKPGDIVFVAGKGHEKYQDIKGVKHPFDDLEVLKEFFEA